MNTSKRKLSVAFGVLVLVGICVVVTILMYVPQRAQALFSRPLVLIHNPINYDQIEIGEGLIIHATARNHRGITRMELWVDGELEHIKEAPEGGASTPLVLSSSWQPTTIGKHTLLVRAISADDVYGQSTITIEAVEAELVLDDYTVEEGDTLESIAAEHGVGEEDLTELNPDMPSGGPAPGDSLNIPSGSGAGESSGTEDVAEAPPADEIELSSDGPAPTPDDTPPGSFMRILSDFFGWEMAEFLDTETDAPLILYMEILDFDTNTTYEDENCYVSLGDGPWDVTDLRGATNTFFWPGDQPLFFSASCAGITGGGTDSVDLGSVAMRIPPEAWDGIVHRITSYGGEGNFSLDYRISQTEPIEKYIDPDMTSPTNVRLDDRRNSLRWDYFPEADEAPIDGFRIYLNGNLQWVEPADERESGLPFEWFHPICGDSYDFTVSAYRYTADDIAESYPSEEPATAYTPIEDCAREVQITFLTLETFDLGGDGHSIDHIGDVGPPYGYFYANERQVTFDARTSGEQNTWRPYGLRHNSMYDLFEMWGDASWGFSGMPSIIVDLPPDGTFEFGFHIMDQDPGRCRDSDDPGCNDLICEGLSTIRSYDSHHYFDTWHEATFTSENGRCRVTYRLGPAFGSPVGSGVEGDEPLPWIQIEEIEIDETTGLMQIHVRNTGSATWPWRDLDVELQTRENESVAIHTWPEFVLEAGQHTVLEFPAPLSPPYDACVVIDPFDRVSEVYERTGALLHTPVCPTLSDLTITDVQYDASGGGRLRVTVQNVGDGSLENRTIALKTILPDGSSAYITGSWPNITLEPGASRTFDLSGVNESARERVRNGYTMVIDPDNSIAESDETNNEFEIPATISIWFDWHSACGWEYVNGRRHRYNIFMTVDVVAGDSSRRVVDWHAPEIDLPWNHYSDYKCWVETSPNEYKTRDLIEVAGDEMLIVSGSATVRVGVRTHNIGSFTRTIDVHNDANTHFWPSQNLECSRAADQGQYVNIVYSTIDLGNEGEWSVRYGVCREEP